MSRRDWPLPEEGRLEGLWPGAGVLQWGLVLALEACPQQPWAAQGPS